MTNISGIPDLKLRLTIEGKYPSGDVYLRDISAILLWTTGEEMVELQRSLRIIAEELAPDRDPDNHPLYPEDV